MLELKSHRVYPVNVDTREIYCGNYTDGKEGYPTIRDCFEEWRGTSITGIYGRHLTVNKYKLVARSIFKEA